MKIRKAKKADIEALLKLYRAAAKTENGLARKPQEISKKFINEFVQNSLKKGLIFLLEDKKEIIAEIHCYQHYPQCFRHVLGNLILVVNPLFHGMGFGKQIFSYLLDEIKNKHRNIVRVELFVRQNNLRGIKLYQSLGFEIEGICKNRILDSKSKLAGDVMMAWFNPKFQK